MNWWRAAIKNGDPLVWLTGAALAASLLMVSGLLVLILTHALPVFWPAPIAHLQLKDGTALFGPIRDRDIPADDRDAPRLQVHVGNRDIYGSDFRWVTEDDIVTHLEPAEAVTLERTEWGNFYGFLAEVRSGDTVVASGDGAWNELMARLPASMRLARRIDALETREIAAVSADLERLRSSDPGSPEMRAAEQRAAELQTELTQLLERSEHDRAILTTIEGTREETALVDIVRIYRPNQQTVVAKLRMYAAKVWELISAPPRESNTEGGVFPALFGTVMMVLIMTVAVVPFGVLAALYLREYARQGILVRIVRIAVNNLAGVPSIVFGVFGLGFFVYFVGGSIDALFYPERLPNPTYGTGGILWASLTLALLTVPVVVVATEEALAAVPREHREASLALGATKLETIWRVVLPNALPGILTGVILAMARAAGEVAPLMITGVVKLAPTLPLDGSWPFFHLDRKFMHLGFHIYDVGFQSPNVEAAKPMVYATTLLLVAIVITLNLGAIIIRNRLRRRYAGSTF